MAAPLVIAGAALAVTAVGGIAAQATVAAQGEENYKGEVEGHGENVVSRGINFLHDGWDMLVSGVEAVPVLGTAVAVADDLTVGGALDDIQHMSNRVGHVFGAKDVDVEESASSKKVQQDLLMPVMEKSIAGQAVTRLLNGGLTTEDSVREALDSAVEIGYMSEGERDRLIKKAESGEILWGNICDDDFVEGMTKLANEQCYETLDAAVQIGYMDEADAEKWKAAIESGKASAEDLMTDDWLAGFEACAEDPTTAYMASANGAYYPDGLYEAYDNRQIDSTDMSVIAMMQADGLVDDKVMDEIEAQVKSGKATWTDAVDQLEAAYVQVLEENGIDAEAYLAEGLSTYSVEMTDENTSSQMTNQHHMQNQQQESTQFEMDALAGKLTDRQGGVIIAALRQGHMSDEQFQTYDKMVKDGQVTWADIADSYDAKYYGGEQKNPSQDTTLENVNGGKLVNTVPQYDSHETSTDGKDTVGAQRQKSRQDEAEDKTSKDVGYSK